MNRKLSLICAVAVGISGWSPFASYAEPTAAATQAAPTTTVPGLAGTVADSQPTATLADAAHGSATLDRGFEAVAQVAMADLIVVTKADLVTPDTLQAFEKRLKTIAPTARQIKADVYAPIDKSRLKNYANLDPAMLAMLAKST